MDESQNQPKQPYFTAKKIAVIAVFTALAFGVSLLEFPIFPAAPYFKLDFSFAVLLLASYSLGALAGEIVAVLSIALHLLVSSSAGAGEVANIIMAQVFAVLPAVVYKYHRNFKTVVISLCVAIVVNCGLGLLSNRFLIFPLFFGDGAAENFNAVWYFALAFNFIKGLANAVITILLYKRLKFLLNKIL